MELNKDKINRELTRLGWTKYDLARKMKVRPQWAYQILSPTYDGITLKTIQKIAEALDCDPKDLII